MLKFVVEHVLFFGKNSSLLKLHCKISGKSMNNFLDLRMNLHFYTTWLNNTRVETFDREISLVQTGN